MGMSWCLGTQLVVAWSVVGAQGVLVVYKPGAGGEGAGLLEAAYWLRCALLVSAGDNRSPGALSLPLSTLSFICKRHQCGVSLELN